MTDYRNQPDENNMKQPSIHFNAIQLVYDEVTYSLEYWAAGSMQIVDPTACQPATSLRPAPDMFNCYHSPRHHVARQPYLVREARRMKCAK